ncbi:hypothetical protein HNQ44_003026 [Planomicrobium koreense]|uniref:Uncharacterized protein n=1 Tax=Planococcus koreensis TaxID=112331 RepID=A0A7W8CUJ4_9BACL|nr:hypothetical protein [Planococcus koreensis]MBB5181561.1 hypothetical protein [Planococcus koreensis]
MKKNDYMIQTRLTNKGDYAVQVEIKSNETEELAMVLAGIKALIGTMDYTSREGGGDSTSEEGRERYNQAMREILGYVADDIGLTTGYYMNELQAQVFLDASDEHSVNPDVQMELIKKYFD